MKKLFSILLLIFASYVLSSQSYQSIFGKDSTEWVIRGGNLDQDFTVNFITTGDTLYNAYNYKVFGKGIYQALIREDTTTGEVWSIYACDKERLVADYSLNKGDSFNISESQIYIQNPADTFIKVDSVYYVSGRKYIRFTSPASSSPQQLTEPILFIEGIGVNYSSFGKTMDVVIMFSLNTYYVYIRME